MKGAFVIPFSVPGLMKYSFFFPVKVIKNLHACEREGKLKMASTKELNEKIQRKDAIEKEILELCDVLTSVNF